MRRPTCGNKKFWMRRSFLRKDRFRESNGGGKAFMPRRGRSSVDGQDGKPLKKGIALCLCELSQSGMIANRRFFCHYVDGAGDYELIPVKETFGL